MAKLSKKNIIIILFALIALALCIVLGQKTYVALIIALIAIYSIANTGLDILFGYTGQISLGHAAFFALGAYTTTLLTMKCGVPSLLSIVVGSVVSTLFGCIVAFPASKLVKHFLSLFTIAFSQIVYLFINSTMSLTGGAGGIREIPDLSLFGYQMDTNFKMMIFSLVLLCLITFLKKRIIESRVGRAFIAIRESSHAAEGLGINVRNYKVLSFAMCAFCGGLAGGLYAFLMHFISPETFNTTQSVMFITMVLFGGCATIAGPLFGSAVLLVMTELLQSFSMYQKLIYALFIIVVLFFFPNGTVGVFNDLYRKFKSKKERRTNDAAVK